jgi:hypothetical protein
MDWTTACMCSDLLFTCFTYGVIRKCACRPGPQKLVKDAWSTLRPILIPAAWLFVAQTLIIMLVDRFTHRLVNEGMLG